MSLEFFELALLAASLAAYPSLAYLRRRELRRERAGGAGTPSFWPHVAGPVDTVGAGPYRAGQVQRYRPGVPPPAVRLAARAAAAYALIAPLWVTFTVLFLGDGPVYGSLADSVTASMTVLVALAGASAVAALWGAASWRARTWHSRWTAQVTSAALLAFGATALWGTEHLLGAGALAERATGPAVALLAYPIAAMVLAIVLQFAIEELPPLPSPPAPPDAACAG